MKVRKVSRLMCPTFLLHKHKGMRSSAKQVPVFIRLYRELCGPEGVVLQQNNILQQVTQEVHTDPTFQGTLSEQQENIGQIITEIYRLREELAKLNLTLKQGFILIDETCAKHASVLHGLQSIAGAQLGTNQNWRRLHHCTGECRQ